MLDIDINTNISHFCAQREENYVIHVNVASLPFPDFNTAYFTIVCMCATLKGWD
jgi:hypothetical protein